MIKRSQGFCPVLWLVDKVWRGQTMRNKKTGRERVYHIAISYRKKFRKSTPAGTRSSLSAKLVTDPTKIIKIGTHERWGKLKVS